MKDKFQSLVGMRGACGWLNDPLITHLSPTNHPLKHYVWRVLTMVVLLFTFGISQMWGTATNFHDFVAAGDTIVDIEGSGSTPSTKMSTINGTDWAAVSTSAKNNSIYRMDPSTEEVATSKTNVYGTKLGSSAKSTYKVTGVSNVIFYVGTGSAGRTAYLDVTENGKSKVSEAASVTLSDKNNAYKMSYTLDASKSYTLEAYAGADLFCYAVKFTVASKCTKPGTPTALAAGSVTHNSASLSWTAGANSDGFKIYIEKKSDKTKVLDWTDCATNSYAASGLDPETTYTFKVKAKGASGYCDLGDEASADFATEVDPSATTYKVTLVPAGGTISDATGWTLNAGNYEKEVSDGAELALPTFTKADRTFKTWRKSGPVDVTSPITVTADVTLTAVWTATVEQVLYSWEGGSPATEVGGTAATAGESGTDNYINIAKGDYYCLQISGGTGYDKYVEITLSGEEKVKTGDKIKYWGFYYKDKSANARPKMRDGNSPNAAIFDDGTNLPNLYDGTGSPAERTFTVPADINTNKVQITRSQTGSNTWIPKLQIIREVQVEEGDLLTVTFNTNGGSSISPMQVASGQAVAKPADPTKAHNRFNEWQLSGSAYNFLTPVTSSITLDATWTPLYTVTYAANGGSGTMTDANEYAAGDEVTLLENTFEAPDVTKIWDSWAVTDALDNPVSVSAGKFAMPSSNATVTAQWTTISDFDVKFFQGYGDPDAQIGETQSISTGNFAAAPADPERAGFAFLGWSYDATEAHIVDVATYGITAATNFTAMWKAVWTVTFDGAGAVNVEDGETVASPNSPVMAGKVFQGWYNAEVKYDFSAAVTGNLALTSKWADADPNHYVYAYNDDFHFDGVVYKTPEGKTKDPEAAEASNVALATNPFTLFSGASGITSIVATNGIYDYKKGAGTKHITAYLKLKADDATSNVVFTIASGYTAVLKLKMNGYSSNATISLKKGDDAVTPSGTQEGTAEGKNYGELTYNLTAGEYTLTTASKTLYISHIDLEATALPTHSVTYKPGDGEGAWVVDADATEVADCPGTFTAPTGKVFNGWKNESDDSDVAVGAIVEDDMNLIAQWINVYAVTFNMNGHGGDAPAAQDIKHGEKAAKPADPSESGWIFGGWFTDNGTFEAPFDFNTLITAATPLYAKWTEDPCPTPFSLSKVVLTSATDGTVTGYNGNEYAGEKVIGGLKDDSKTADITGDAAVEKGYKLNSGGNSIVFATLKKGEFQEGDRVTVGVIYRNDSRTVDEATNILTIYAGSDKDHTMEIATLTGVSDPGFYTYRLTAADVAAINAAGYKGIGVFRASSNGENHNIYSVEIQGCREWAIFHTLTFKNIDGTATIAAEPLEEGAYASTVAPVAPKIAMKRFLGWAEAIDGTPVDLTAYTITEDKTLYAVYEDIVCPTTGTVYKFEIKDELPSENLPTSTDKDMSSYITAIGDGYLTYTATANNKATINSAGTIQMKDASAAYLKVELECALAAGDQIRAHVTNNPMRVQVGTTYDSNKDLILAKNAYEFVAITSAMEGKQVLYITRSSNGNANLADFEIYRPAKYDVSFNMMGHGSAIADLEDVVEGSKIAAPSPAPADVDYSFAGWYKENTLENEWKFDVDVVETNTTLYAKWLDKSDATLKSLKYGETEIALEAGVYTYNVSLPAFTSAVPALTAETSNPSATKVIANAAAFDSEGNATSTVTVTPEVGADQVYTVNFAKGVEILLQDVTGSITWNFANAVTANVNITGTPQVLANYGGVTNDNTFESDKLEASGEKFTAGSNANLRANYIRFHTTVPGKLSISYSNTGGSNPARYIYVNGVKYDEEGSANTTPKGADSKVFVPAGDVELVMKDGEDASKNVQIYQMIFNATPDYTRNVTEGRYGTICLPNGGVMVGAELFEVAYYGATSQKVFLDNILSGEMEAGVPYIFLPREGASQLGVFYTDEANASAGSHNGLIGFIGDAADEYFYIPAGEGNYILQNNLYREVLAGAQARILSNRAYIKLSAINPTEPALAPGRRRVSMSVLSEQVTTGMENIGFESEAPRKVLINGELFIIRGEKMFDAKGQLVK